MLTQKIVLLQCLDKGDAGIVVISEKMVPLSRYGCIRCITTLAGCGRSGSDGESTSVSAPV